MDSVARDLGVPPQTVMEMEKRLSARDSAFDMAVETEEDESRPAPVAYLQDLRFEPASRVEDQDWEDHSNGRLRDALETLDARSRDILEKRWLADEKSTLQDLADRYRVSAERIRQLEKTALKKLKAIMEA